MQKKNMIRFISVNTAAKTDATISTGAKIIFINVKITVNKYTCNAMFGKLIALSLFFFVFDLS